MIRYDTDGATLIDGDGKRVTIWDNPRYSDLLVIMAAQLSAAGENAHATDMYMGALRNAQASLDAGRSAPAPIKPQMKTVSDAGVETLSPFVPALPDLVIPVTHPSTGSIVTLGTVDKDQIMRNQVDAIFRKMFPAA